MMYILIFVVLFISSCHSKDCYSPPQPFEAKMLDAEGRNILAESNLPEVSIYYLQDGSKVDVHFYVDEVYNTLVSSELPSVSGKEKIAPLYIAVGQSVDTLRIDVSERACTSYTINTVSFNGEAVAIDDSGNFPVFLLEKK